MLRIQKVIEKLIEKNMRLEEFRDLQIHEFSMVLNFAKGLIRIIRKELNVWVEYQTEDGLLTKFEFKVQKV